MDRSINQRIHARRRFLERFGIRLNKSLRNGIKYLIEKNRLVMINISYGMEMYYYEYSRKQIIIVYDPIEQNIVSCLYYDIYLATLYKKMSKVIANRIRKQIEVVIGREFSVEENKQVAGIILKELIPIRKVARSEVKAEFISILNKEVDMNG